ncbi:Uncharacterised protein [Mycobacteroides abscessus subsp. abscessus]|nr:Uncharacterised protein [Mycobacteroides abscessus subsp. abscessus]
MDHGASAVVNISSHHDSAGTSPAARVAMSDISVSWPAHAAISHDASSLPRNSSASSGGPCGVSTARCTVAAIAWRILASMPTASCRSSASSAERSSMLASCSTGPAPSPEVRIMGNASFGSSFAYG